MDNQLITALSNYFGNLPSDMTHALHQLFTHETLEKDNYWLRENQYCKKMSFIEEGLLRVYVDTEHKSVTQWIAFPGTFITDMSSFMGQSPAMWNVYSLSKVSMYTIHHNDYIALNKQFPSWNELEKKFIIKCFITLEKRLFTHLSMNAEERYHYYFEHFTHLFNQVPLQYIASMLGMSAETLSRIRAKQFK